MLPSGADVKIGAYEFLLDDSVPEPYAHEFESLYSDTQQIQGSAGVTANPNVLAWTFDDFAGGAETKYYNPDIPDTYWYGKVNPRIRGSLTAPPTVASSTVTVGTTATEAYFVAVGGTLWLFVDRHAFYSTDNGATWTGHAQNPIFSSGFTINGATSDGNYPWVSATASGQGFRSVLRIDSTTSKSVAVNNVTAGARTYGMATLEGKIYLWTGGSLIEYNSLATLPITHSDAVNRVHTPFTESPA